jgi:formylglycine-generating enzyme required for sulfatase activity
MRLQDSECVEWWIRALQVVKTTCIGAALLPVFLWIASASAACVYQVGDTDQNPPQAVTDLSITVVDSAHVRLEWSPVAADTSGSPLDCVVYDLHKGNEAAFTPGPTTWLDSTSTTSYTDSLAGEMAFYRLQVQPCVTTSPHDMVLVPAGIFVMGQNGVAPAHPVQLTHNFLLSTTEVTNAQFLEALNWANAQDLVSVVGDYVQQFGVNLLRIDQSGQDSYEIRYNAETQQFFMHAGTWDAGSIGPGEAYPGGIYDPSTHPVVNLTWYGAACYCDWRSQMEGLDPFYNGNWESIPGSQNPYLATGYRLPTEAEWEYAARFSDNRVFPWGFNQPTCGLANFRAFSSPTTFCVGWTNPVGSFSLIPSQLGFYDLAGNVWEWCNDWFAMDPGGIATDPVGPADGTQRILKGGGWKDASPLLQCAYRGAVTPTVSVDHFGFRLCRTAP